MRKLLVALTVCVAGMKPSSLASCVLFEQLMSVHCSTNTWSQQSSVSSSVNVRVMRAAPLGAMSH
jgi:hypothetical protein